jgi:prepilin-type N-terminal cleavage/methylation domain-containing protein
MVPLAQGADSSAVRRAAQTDRENPVLQRLRAVRDSDDGFTLTELLITIIILGVLAGIVVFAVGAFTKEGHQAACETDRKAVELAATAYFAKNAGYPTSSPEVSATNIATLVTTGYLKEAPNSPYYTITLTNAGVVGPLSCVGV